ncbi:hypothetical protein [Rhodoblastus sp.]|uniref:hypothetical protein n=1 Tax=Rhodoblastus sp. TaxID=1962975 RepID=UPI003F9CB3F8
MKKLLFAIAAIALLVEPVAAMPIRVLQQTTVGAPTIEKAVYVGTRGSARRTVRRHVRRHTY